MSEIILFLLLALSDYEHVVGSASRYDPGIMSATAAYHGHDLSKYDGAIAALSCDWIGQEWLLRKPGGDWQHVIVSDCAGDEQSFLWLQNNNILVELSYSLTVKLNAVEGGIEIEVIRPTS